MNHRIAIIQVYRVERRIEIDAEGTTAEEACMSAELGIVDTPAFDDPGWTEYRTLESDTIHPV